jgi:serine/threonine protein kinase
LEQFQAICELIAYPTKETWPDFFSEARKESRKEFEKCSIYRKSNIKQFFEELSGSKMCVDLFSKIICWDPNQRISLAEMLAHPYFFENPRPIFPDELKILPRIDFYAKRCMEDINKRRSM